MPRSLEVCLLAFRVIFEILVFVFCVEAAADRRIILLALKDAGYDTDEFVFLFADGRRAGFGGSTLLQKQLLHTGSPAIWVDSTEPTDGRDDDARVAARKVLVVSMQALKRKFFSSKRWTIRSQIPRPTSRPNSSSE